MPLAPFILCGDHVRLEPINPGHVDALAEVACDRELWRWMYPPLTTRDDVATWVETAVRGQAAGHTLAFAICCLRDRCFVGSTRLMSYVPQHLRAEIGWTWVARPWQRTAVNTEAKLLLLTHAFEALLLRRVEFKTDALNAPSRAALERLGATEEGTLRRHMIMSGGRARDSVYYSILDEEWPAVRARLRERLGRHADVT